MKVGAIAVLSISASGMATGSKSGGIRVQGEYASVYRRLMTRGARVRWTDLRMSVFEFAESRPANGGVVLSNWEI